MVNSMHIHTKNLYQRAKYFIAGAAAGNIILLLVLAACLLMGTIEATGWTEGLLLLTVCLLVLQMAGICLYLYRPYKIQRDLDQKFAGDDKVTVDEYAPVYYWSDSNRAVIRKFQTAADREKIMELSIQSSRYMALQRQINPHFLYNTLDAIRSDMMIAGNIEIADTVEALSKYFAYAVSNMEQVATIYEELENVRDYFHIQKYRFEDRLGLKIIDKIGAQEIQETQIPRLTLQPLVENAIVHGLETTSHYGTVTIQLSQTSDKLMIHVADDGIGMDADELCRLNERLRQSFRQKNSQKRGGIALDNVNSRIKLLFGEDYGLRVFSMKNVGTDISVMLPLVKKEQ